MRYFSCSVQNGYVYMHYITGSGLSHHDADELADDARRIESVAELDAIVRESVGRSR